MDSKDLVDNLADNQGLVNNLVDNLADNQGVNNLVGKHPPDHQGLNNLVGHLWEHQDLNNLVGHPLDHQSPVNNLVGNLSSSVGAPKDERKEKKQKEEDEETVVEVDEDFEDSGHLPEVETAPEPEKTVRPLPAKALKPQAKNRPSTPSAPLAPPTTKPEDEPQSKKRVRTETTSVEAGEDDEAWGSKWPGKMRGWGWDQDAKSEKSEKMDNNDDYDEDVERGFYIKNYFGYRNNYDSYEYRGLRYEDEDKKHTSRNYRAYEDYRKEDYYSKGEHKKYWGWARLNPLWQSRELQATTAKWLKQEPYCKNKENEFWTMAHSLFVCLCCAVLFLKDLHYKFTVWAMSAQWKKCYLWLLCLVIAVAVSSIKIVFMSLLSPYVSAIQFNPFFLSLLQELGGCDPEPLCELVFEKGKAGDLNAPDVYRWPDGIEVHISAGDVVTREDSYLKWRCLFLQCLVFMMCPSCCQLSCLFLPFPHLLFYCSQELEASRDKQLFMADEAPLQSSLLQLQSIQTLAVLHSLIFFCQERRQNEYPIIPPSQPKAW